MRIEMRSESPINSDPATVTIYDDDDKVVAKIVATIAHRQGADGGYYPCVTLRGEEQQVTSTTPTITMVRAAGGPKTTIYVFDSSQVTAAIFVGDSTWHCSQDAETKAWVGVCDDLRLTAEGDTVEGLVNVIKEILAVPR